MTPLLPTRSFAASFRARPGLRSLVVGLFLLIQTLLVAHQLEHGLHPDLTGPPDDCVLCQVSANLLPAPEPAVVIVPVDYVSVPLVPAAEQKSAPRIFVADYRSRAPPAFVSI